MRPSPLRRVLPACALLLPACGEGGSGSGGETSSLAGSGTSAPAPTVAADTGPDDGPTTAETTAATTDIELQDSTGTGTTAGSDAATTGTTGFVGACTPPHVVVDDVPTNDACDIPLQVGGFEPVIEWKWGTSSFCGPAVVGQTVDTNGSGAIDAADLPLVFLYQYSSVVALWGDGSGVAWQADGAYGSDGGFALGDVDGDGWPDIVTASNNQVCALDGRDGAVHWCNPYLADSMDPHSYNYPALADMDGDGSVEVIIGDAILDSAGAVIGTGKLGKGATPWANESEAAYGALSAVVDLDGDGVQEVVTGNAAYDLDGNTIWENGGDDGFVAVADFDLDGDGEIVKVSGFEICGMNTDGSHAWGPIGFAGNLGPPAIDDLDGDGTPELVVGAQQQLVAMAWGGATIWTAPISDESGAAGPVLFDFESDGFPEVLYADEIAIRFFSGVDGSLKFMSDKHASYTIFETPIVADVDGDDHVEIVLGHCTANEGIGAISVYGDAGDTWPPGRKIWNQHTYQISNIRDLGAVPGDFNSNWLPPHNFNSFRSGDIGQKPGEYTDLQAEIVELCEADCSDGTITLSARVRNAGTTLAPAAIAVSVRAGVDGPTLATLATTAPIPPGKTGDLLVFKLAVADLAGATAQVQVDDTGVGEGSVFECDEQNNTAFAGGPVCAIR